MSFLSLYFSLRGLIPNNNLGSGSGSYSSAYFGSGSGSWKIKVADPYGSGCGSEFRSATLVRRQLFSVLLCMLGGSGTVRTQLFSVLLCRLAGSGTVRTQFFSVLLRPMTATQRGRRKRRRRKERRKSRRRFLRLQPSRYSSLMFGGLVSDEMIVFYPDPTSDVIPYPDPGQYHTF